MIIMTGKDPRPDSSNFKPIDDILRDLALGKPHPFIAINKNGREVRLESRNGEIINPVFEALITAFEERDIRIANNKGEL